MSDAKQVIVGGVPISLKDEEARNSIGNLSNLNTTAKNNLVAAINEAAQSGSGEGSDPEAVKYTSQSLTTSQKEQARTNIGAGTYSKPSGGIPASDLASGVVPDVSGLYTKPAGGIPASDLASGVIPDVSGKQDTLVSGTNIKTINQTSLLGSGDIVIPKGDTGDTGATPDFSIGTVQTGAAGSSAAATITGTAAAPVLNLVIPKGDQGNTGSSVEYPYELVNNRTTDDATKGLSAAEGKRLGDDLNQLEAEVHNLSGKFYGVFADDSDLPEGDTVGYAFVGSENPYAIWNFDGEEWSDSGSVANGITGEPGVGFSSIFTPDPYDGTVIIVISNNDTITLDLNHNHPAYFSKVLGGAQPVGGFDPDVVYSLGTLSGTITFSLASPVTGNVNHYFWMFDTGVSAPTIIWPAGLTWADGSAPTVAASKHYEISIMDGIAAYLEV